MPQKNKQPTAPVATPLASTPANIALLQSRLAAQSTELKVARASAKVALIQTRQAERLKFSASLLPRVPLDTRSAFTTLFAALQKGTAKPEHLEQALAAMPVHPLFQPIQADLSIVEPRSVDAQKHADEEGARTYAARRNRAGKSVPQGEAA